MTPRLVEQLIKDYNNGNGLCIKELAAKYHVSYYVIRNTLIRACAYVPPRKLYDTHTHRNGSIEWELLHAEILLQKVIERHEGGLLPDRSLYLKIKEYFKNTKNGVRDIIDNKNIKNSK